MEIQGTVFKIMPETRGVSARGEWQRQDVIFEMMDGQYARKIAITFFNRPSDVQALSEGVSYNVSINIESREYNGRWYTDVRAWRVLPADGSVAAPQMESASSFVAPSPATTPTTSASEDVDDLPF